MHAIKESYGDKITVSVSDPRDIFSVLDNVRYRVKLCPAEPAWILDSNKFCDGIPELSDLQRAIEEKLV